MNKNRLLLCTDMDRTVIPNGVESEDGQARRRFRAFCQQSSTDTHELTLVYVTGRHEALVRDAVKNFRLPSPAYVISDVGSKIYQVMDTEWIAHRGWEKKIGPDWNGLSREHLQHLLGDIRELKRQEISRQNTYKLSYFLPLFCNREEVLQQVEEKLQAEGVAANLIYSIDEPRHIGLLDILPRSASKLHAILFLQNELGFTTEEVLFAGDSGNDLAVLSSSIPSVLVANASEAIKEEARALARQNGFPEALYIAEPGTLGMNGNYSAGVLAGVWHYTPAFRQLLAP